MNPPVEYHKVVFHAGTKQIPVTHNIRGAIHTVFNEVPIEIPYEVGREKSVRIRDANGEMKAFIVNITRITYEQVAGGLYAFRIHVICKDLPEVVHVDMFMPPFKAVMNLEDVWGLNLIEDDYWQEESARPSIGSRA
jgi:hypothetical protein